MDNKKVKTIRVGYLCTSTTTIYNGHRSSNGWIHGWHTRFTCYGLKTDCEHIDFSLQDYEIFQNIEKELRPKNYEEKDSGSDYEMWDEPGTTSESTYDSKQIAKALNTAFSKIKGLHFEEAVYGEDELAYDFSESIGAKDFQDYIRIEISAEYKEKQEIAAIEKQIKDLENKKRNLLLSHNSYLFTNEMINVIKDLVGKGRIELNTRMPNLQDYPLDIAYRLDKGVYELMLKSGATKQNNSWFIDHPLLIGSWYGFFKFTVTGANYLSDEMVDVVIGELPALDDEQIKTLLLSDNPILRYDDLTVKSERIQLIRDYIITCLEDDNYSHKVDEGLLVAFEKLVQGKRYSTINLLREFVSTIYIDYDIDKLLLVTCLKLKDLDSLRNMKVHFFTSYFTEANWYVIVDAVKQYYKEDYIGKEMMDYIKMHMENDHFL